MERYKGREIYGISLCHNCQLRFVDVSENADVFDRRRGEYSYNTIRYSFHVRDDNLMILVATSVPTHA